MLALKVSRDISINIIESVSDVDSTVNVSYCTTCIYGDQTIDPWIVNLNPSKIDYSCDNF